MNDWKQAFTLAKFELKISVVNILISWFVMTFFSMSFFTSFSKYLEKSYYGFDIFFILGLSFGPLLFRSKHYQYQKFGDDFYASPTYIMMNKLPIPKKVLALSRLLIIFIYVLPFMVTVFPLMYLTIPVVSEVMDVSAFIAFFIIWLLIVLILGMTLPASDPGDRLTWGIVALYFVGAWLAIVTFSGLFHHFTGSGFVAWTIKLANDWAIPTIAIAIILFIISWRFWLYQMVKKTKKLDYF